MTPAGRSARVNCMYTKIDESELPDGLRFDVPRMNQGQNIEAAYAAWPTTRYEAGVGDKYKRVTNRVNQTITYYKLTELI